MGRHLPLAHFLDVWEARIRHHYCIQSQVPPQPPVSSRSALAAEDSVGWNKVVLVPMLRQGRFWCACVSTVQLGTFVCASVQSGVERICVVSCCDLQLSLEIGYLAVAIWAAKLGDENGHGNASAYHFEHVECASQPSLLHPANIYCLSNEIR